MAIGTLAAIGIGLAGAGAVASGISQNKAASKAADATQYAADQSAQVLRENYDKSAQALAPWQTSGLRANNAIDALLGLGGSQAQPTPQPVQAMPFNLMGGFNGGIQNDITRLGGARSQLEAMPQDLWNWDGILPGPVIGIGGGTWNVDGTQATPVNRNALTAAALTPQQAQTSQQAQNAAFDNFRNSTGYQFRLGEGMNALNSGFAGAGSIKSGAAMKEAMKYGQNFASNEFGNYFNMLNNQAGKGLSAASAQAGVSQNLGNNLANIQMQQGDNLANAALAKTSPFGNALSMLGGGAMKFGK